MDTNIEKQIILFKSLAIIAIVISLGLLAFIITTTLQESKLITTQGIIIKDNNGRDRILIGTPIPFSENRVKTDSVRAWETYVKRWPEDYHEKIWNWYKDYNHSSNGILILNEDGYDRISLGDPTPDPSIGKRIAPGTGLVLMDEKGDERSGYSILPIGDGYRVVLGLDSDKGTEGLALVVDDAGYNNMTISGNNKFIFLGSADTTHWATKPNNTFDGLIIRNKDSILTKVQ